MIAFSIQGRAGSPLPAADSNAIHGAHGVTRPTWRSMSGIIKRSNNLFAETN
jgi:hypothetical protein